jgi:hypothetical protein
MFFMFLQKIENFFYKNLVGTCFMQTNIYNLTLTNTTLTNTTLTNNN